jgi:ribosomal protein S18 acetylase RimI-like enzyme
MSVAEDAAIDIRPIGAQDTHALRDTILRPGQPPGGSIYPGDDGLDTLHLGAFVGSTLVAVATICREAAPGTRSTTCWRLRGMATLAEFRARGLGKELARRCIVYAAGRRGALVWCTSRIATVAFYRTLGFVECGEAFTLPQYSDALYIRMERPLP